MEEKEVRLIDADALTKEIKQDIADNGLTERYVFYRINDAPSIDIVRCAECKHWRNTDAEKIPTASIACGNMHPDDF